MGLPVLNHIEWIIQKLLLHGLLVGNLRFHSRDVKVTKTLFQQEQFESDELALFVSFPAGESHCGGFRPHLTVAFHLGFTTFLSLGLEWQVDLGEGTV